MPHHITPSMRDRARQAMRHALALGCPVLLLPGPASSADYSVPDDTLAVVADAPTDSATLPALTVIGAPTSERSERTARYTIDSTSASTRLDLSPRETPQSVSVITRTQIDDFALDSVNDMLSTATGVNVERVETDRTYFSVRGFEVNNFQYDGVGLPFATGDQQGDLDTIFYDRVEVLRGANGLLSSTGNPSATVNFVRKRPTTERQFDVGGRLGSWNSHRVDADLSGRINGSGSVRGRILGAAQEGSSYLDRYAKDKLAFAAMIEADVTPDTVIAIGHQRQHNRPNGVMWGGLPFFYVDGSRTDYDVSASTAADWTYWNTDDVQTFGELTQRLGGEWKAKLSLLHHHIQSDAELFYVFGTPDRATGTGLFSWPSKYGHDEAQWISDLYVTGPFMLAGRRHEAVFGGNIADSQSDLHSSDDDLFQPLTEAVVLAGTFPVPGFDNGVTGSGEFHDRRRSLYGALRLSLTDDAKLFGGVNVTRTFSDGVQYGVAHAYEATRALPFVGATWDLLSDYTLYASYATIFRPVHEIDVDGAVLSPIEGDTIEGGIKGEWFDGRLYGTLAAFRTAQDNTPEYAGFAGGRSYYQGVDARSLGYEIDVAGRLTSIWDISAGFTHLSIEDADGNAVRTYVPRETLRLTSTVRVPRLPGLKLGASLKWQGEISRDQGGGIETVQNGYALLDLMASYEFAKDLTLTANVINVTDQQYINSLLWAQGYYGQPLSAAVALHWRY